MRKIITSFLILVFFVSCDDGNFETPSFEFDATVGNCGEHVLYRLSSTKTEALIITLNSTVIDTITTVIAQVPITATNVNYRVFESELTPNTYFCMDIPPTSPIVARDWEAVSGNLNTISIETSNVRDASEAIIGHKHLIQLHNLVLENNGDSIIYETYDFGSFETSI